MGQEQVEIFSGHDLKEMQDKINAFLGTKRKYTLQITHVTQSSIHSGSIGVYTVISIFYVLKN